MDKKDLRIVFMGTPVIAQKLLQSLIDEGYQIVGVIAQPDRPKGRKKELLPVPTKIVAMNYHLPCAQPLKIRQEYDFLYEWKPDLIITLAYGQIVPQAVLDIPRYGCLNLHGSLLPKYRGAAPIQYALINNESVTGMTLMEMTAQMDAGRIFGQEKVMISADDNATSLFDKMAEAAIKLTLRELPHYIEGKLQGILQNESDVTFAPTIKKEQEKLDLSMPTDEILGWIRGLSDEPGGYVFAHDQKWKLLRAHYFDDHQGEIGTLTVIGKDTLLVQVGDGRIAIDEIQKEGKPRMDIKSFLNGMPHPENIKLR